MCDAIGTTAIGDPQGAGVLPRLYGERSVSIGGVTAAELTICGRQMRLVTTW